MDLKNAIAICLISFFSATLVVLIARSLDVQAASRLEPQLAQIVEELRAIRSQGTGFSAGPVSETDNVQSGLIVYYFHGNIRCPTCRSIESQTKEVVDHDFADQLERGTIVWKVLNYEKPESSKLVTTFGIQMANVVIARMEGGELKEWKRLDQVWALYGAKDEFARFMRAEITQLLDAGQLASGITSVEPVGDASTLDLPTGDIPVPQGPAFSPDMNESLSDIPVPD